MGVKDLKIELGSPGSTGITMVDLKINLASPGNQVFPSRAHAGQTWGTFLWNVDAMLPNVHVRTAGSGVRGYGAGRQRLLGEE